MKIVNRISIIITIIFSISIAALVGNFEGVFLSEDFIRKSLQENIKKSEKYFSMISGIKYSKKYGNDLLSEFRIENLYGKSKEINENKI